MSTTRNQRTMALSALSLGIVGLGILREELAKV